MLRKSSAKPDCPRLSLGLILNHCQFERSRGPLFSNKLTKSTKPPTLTL